jgi:dienelactone hydrolase
MRTLSFLMVVALSFSGCGVIEQRLFPIWEPNFFAANPAELGPFSVMERRVEVEDGADGRPYGITVFEPMDAAGPLPVFMWVMGSNVQAYYHQALHEALASWGYLVLVPDTRPLLFTDFQYHNRIVQLAEQTLDLATLGDIGPSVNAEQIAAGGYSIGGPLAAFTAARADEVAALVYWAPSGSPIWQGVRPDDLYPLVDEPSIYVLGELDDDAPAEGGFPQMMQDAMPDAHVTKFVIAGATHHQFQQPTGADEFSNTPGITREEQQRVAINTTREWLDGVFGITRE